MSIKRSHLTAYTESRLAVDQKLVTARAAPARAVGDGQR